LLWFVLFRLDGTLAIMRESGEEQVKIISAMQDTLIPALDKHAARFARARERAPATMRVALSNSLAQVGVRRSPQMRAFASHFSTLANQAISKSPTAVTALGLAGIDSTLETSGPTYLTNPHTLGAGTVNLNVLGGTSELDGL